MSRDTSAGRTTCLSCFECFAIGDTATDIIDDFAQGCTHWNFNKTCVVDFTTNSKYFCAFALFCADRFEPICTFVDDGGDICIGFNIV